jgi:hypothetical protein
MVLRTFRQSHSLARFYGEYTKARLLIRESLSLCQSRGDKRSVVHCLSALAALPDQMPNRSFAVHLLSTIFCAVDDERD